MTDNETSKPCSLAVAAGRREWCPEGACAFWEPGGAALDGRCALDRLDVAGNGPLATWLLEIRERLAAEGTANDDYVLSGLFHHVLNGSPE